MHPLKIQVTLEFGHVFKVGDVVIYVDDSEDPSPAPWKSKVDHPWLAKGRIYRITWTGWHQLVGDLVNIDQDPDWFMETHAWEAKRFRHLNEEPILDVVKRIKAD